MDDKFHSTTIVAVRDANGVCMIGDGQVTGYGSVVIKGNAKKVLRIGNPKNPVLVGFAGSVADCFALIDKFEMKLEKNSGDMEKTCVELAKEWRQDKYMRLLEASLIVTDGTSIINMDGSGVVISVEENVCAIGSGGLFALSAAHGIMRSKENYNATEVATTAMEIASDLCVFTNKNFVKEWIDKV